MHRASHVLHLLHRQAWGHSGLPIRIATESSIVTVAVKETTSEDMAKEFSKRKRTCASNRAIPFHSSSNVCVESEPSRVDMLAIRELAKVDSANN